MITMLKEKVNTHFSFPMELNMSQYMESTLTPCPSSSPASVQSPQVPLMYDLIGVTVHTGTADGGHYYSFIRDMTSSPTTQSESSPKWYLFNDADVKPFEASAAQLASECFGGEVNSKQYDTHADRLVDCAIEKTNSAYMLFYARRDNRQSAMIVDKPNEKIETHSQKAEDDTLLASIWKDNFKCLNHRNLFEQAYFNFVWQLCNLEPTAVSSTNENNDTIDSRLFFNYNFLLWILEK